METKLPNRTLHVVLWILQALNAVTLLWGAFAKLFQPADQLAAMMPWAADNPVLVTVTGIFDMLGGLGLVLPALLRIMPKLTIYAAYGTAALMLSAIVFHAMRGEYASIGLNMFILLITVFIIWGRTFKAPVTPAVA